MNDYYDPDSWMNDSGYSYDGPDPDWDDEWEDDRASTLEIFLRATILAVVVAAILFGLCLAGC